jgi:uncharacterized integral membrane protein
MGGAALAEKPSELQEKMRGVVHWVKVVALVVLITLLVILVLQNIKAKSEVAYIFDTATFRTAWVIFAALAAGSVATLLAVLLRRNSGK